jgi:hypothetical protein
LLETKTFDLQYNKINNINDKQQTKKLVWKLAEFDISITAFIETAIKRKLSHS